MLPHILGWEAICWPLVGCARTERLNSLIRGGSVDGFAGAPPNVWPGPSAAALLVGAETEAVGIETTAIPPSRD